MLVFNRIEKKRRYLIQLYNMSTVISNHFAFHRQTFRWFGYSLVSVSEKRKRWKTLKNPKTAPCIVIIVFFWMIVLLVVFHIFFAVLSLFCSLAIGREEKKKQRNKWLNNNYKLNRNARWLIISTHSLLSFFNAKITRKNVCILYSCALRRQRSVFKEK